MAKKIVVIPGDGIGKEITDSAVEVLKKAAEKCSLELEYEYKDEKNILTLVIALS